jgi:hypothetical protein
MRTIWKFPLVGSTVKIPKGARFLDLQMQDGIPVAWALVDPRAEREELKLYMIGTGWDCEDEVGGSEYLGSIQNNGLVFHFFVQRSP